MFRTPPVTHDILLAAVSRFPESQCHRHVPVTSTRLFYTDLPATPMRRASKQLTVLLSIERHSILYVENRTTDPSRSVYDITQCYISNHITSVNKLPVMGMLGNSMVLRVDITMRSKRI